MDSVYSNLFNSFKSEQYQFDFSNDCLIVDNELKSKGTFIRYDALRKDDFEAYIKKTTFAFTSLPLNQDEFINTYMEFMKNYKSYNRNNKYATRITLIYPKALVSVKDKEKFIKKYVEDLCGIKVDVPYFVENVYKKNCTYARITIIERAYLGKKVYKIYTTNKYIDNRTGKWAAKHCPDEFKIIRCKKGEFVYKDGKKILSDAVFSNSLRIFSYAKDITTKRDLWEEFNLKLKQIYINTILSICKKVQAIKGGKRLHKINNKPEYHRFVKRRIATINYAKQVIEYTVNFLLQNECENDIIYQPYNDAKDSVIKHSKRYKQIVKIFMKYKERFKKQCFHDEEGVEYKIDYYKMRVDILDQHIEKLIMMFFNDITNFLENEI